MIIANKHGHISCTQGGESMAGFMKAIHEDLVSNEEIGILVATAHALKFASFQEMYFANRFPPEFEVKPKKELTNTPIFIQSDDSRKLQHTGKSFQGEERDSLLRQLQQKLPGFYI